MNKPAISVFPAEYDFTEATYMPETYSQLIHLLADSIMPIEMRNAEDFGIWRMTQPSQSFSFTQVRGHGVIEVYGRPVAAWWHRWRGLRPYNWLSGMRDRISRLDRRYQPSGSGREE